MYIYRKQELMTIDIMNTGATGTNYYRYFIMYTGATGTNDNRYNEYRSRR